MEKQVLKGGSCNRCANFVQNAELSNDTKDYLVCLGMLEDLNDKMFSLLLRDWGEEQFNEEWDAWHEVSNRIGSMIMERFKDKMLSNIDDVYSNSL